MNRITFYLDFISPYAWLAFERLPEVMEGLSYSVEYRPVVLAASLKHHGSAAPVSIASKRDWIYRHATWLGHSLGVPLQMPAVHPFDPLPLLRQALACSISGSINRYTAGTVLRHVWAEGGNALEPARLDALALALSPQTKPGREPGDSTTEALLRSSADQAAATGIFGVPAFLVDDKLFWGLDSLPMLRAYLAGDVWFESAWTGAGSVAGGPPPLGA